VLRRDAQQLGDDGHRERGREGFDEIGRVLCSHRVDQVVGDLPDAGCQVGGATGGERSRDKSPEPAVLLPVGLQHLASETCSGLVQDVADSRKPLRRW
jgi:hypothetical protein